MVIIRGCVRFFCGVYFLLGFMYPGVDKIPMIPRPGKQHPFKTGRVARGIVFA